MAFGSNRPAGRWLVTQVPTVKSVVPGPQVLNGSRTNPLDAAVNPDTLSTAPAVTGRVVVGSKMVPMNTVRPRGSVSVLVWSRSDKSVKPEFRSATVGTPPVRIVP